jgi:hypothetical protein
MLIAIDYLYQLCFVVSRYDTAGAIPYELYSSTIVDFGTLTTSSIISIAFAFIIQLIFSAFALLVFRNYEKKYYQSKHFEFKVLSMGLVMVRTLPFCLATKVFIDSITEFSNAQNSSMEYFSLTMSIGGLVLLVVIQYFSASLFNLALPNSILPWSETSPSP